MTKMSREKLTIDYFSLTSLLGEYIGDKRFNEIRTWLPFYILKVKWSSSEEFDTSINRCQNEIDAMTVRTTISSKTCQVWKDFNRNFYDKCFNRTQ